MKRLLLKGSDPVSLSLRLGVYSVAVMATALLLPSLGMSQSTWLNKFNFELGGGVTPTVGQTRADLSNGWNALAGIGYNFDQPLGVRLEFMYDGLGVTNAALRRVDEPAGNAHMWSLTLDPVLRFINVGPFHAYAIVGGGYYRRTVQFTQPTTATVFVFDPWWGYFGPAVVPANQVLGTVTKGAGGANGGLGLSVRVGHHTSMFVEARYHYVWTSNRATQILPITFGVRW